MSLYTQLNDATIREIIQQYDIGVIQSWKILQGGAENTNYLICTEAKKYVLTLCERKTVKETTLLAKILAHLEQQDFDTSRLLKTKTGDSVSFYQNKPMLLKSYIEGRIEANYEQDLLVKLGKKIARLNQLPPIPKIPHHFSYGLEHFHEVYRGFEHPFVDWLKEIHLYLKNNLQTDSLRTLIHGDIFTSNIIITEENDPIIMDFEEACYYYRLFDIGMAIVGTCAEYGRLDSFKIRYLLEGYHQESPLKPQEIRQLKAFVVYAATATAFWRFRQFNVLVPMEERKDSYKEMQNLAIQAKNMDFNHYTLCIYD